MFFLQKISSSIKTIIFRVHQGYTLDLFVFFLQLNEQKCMLSSSIRYHFADDTNLIFLVKD